MVIKKISPAWPYLETVIFIFILAIIDQKILTEAYAFRDLAFNPLWIVIFLIAGRYGTAPGVFAGLLCSAYYIYASLIENFFYGNFSISNSDRTVIFSFLFFSAMLGQMYDRILNSYRKLSTDHNDLQDQFNNLLTHHWALQKANVELEKRFVRRQTTMKSLYDMARNLESLEHNALYLGVIDILERFIKARRCCFYLIKPDKSFELVARSGYNEADLKTLISKPSINSLCQKAVHSEAAVSFLDGHEEQTSLPEAERCLIAAPIRHETTHELLGLITVDEAPVLSFNAGNMRIINMITDWTSRALIKSNMVDELKEKEIDESKTGTYSYRFFNTRLAEEASRFMRHSTPFSVAVLRINNFSEIDQKSLETLNQSLREVFSRSIRFHDLICRYRDESMFAILFPLSDEAEGGFHLRRLGGNLAAAALKPYGDDTPLSFSIFLQTVKENQPETMYRLKPEAGAEIVKKALDARIEKNETII